MKKEYSDDELIRRVWDVEEIKKTVYKRNWYISNEMRAEELDALWVSDPEYKKTASFGRNTGYYVGMDAIRKYYVDHHAEEAKGLQGEGQELYTGYLSNHPASTGLVELAGDGKTAKGLWYCISQETRPNGDGTAKALWMGEKMGIDFVKEGDTWKIWHIVIANDLYNEAGEDYSKQPVYHDYTTNPVDLEFGKPTIEVLTHNTDFNWWDDYPFMPEPYETFSDAISYGPEGFKRPHNYGMNSKEGGNFR
jgi:hypothetical protein